MKRRAIAAVVAAASLWGLMGLFVRRFSAAGLGSLETTQLRITLGCLLLGAYLLLFHREKFRVRLRDLWCFVGTGIVSLLLFSLLLFPDHDIDQPGGGRRAALHGSGVRHAAQRAAVPGTDHRRQDGGAADGGGGLRAGVRHRCRRRAQRRGAGPGPGIGLFYALYSIFGRYAIRRGYDSWTITFYTFLFCAAGGALLCSWGDLGKALLSGGAPLWLWAVLMGLLTAFAAYLLYTWGLQRIESSRASILASVEPVVAALAGVFVFEETLPLSTILGILLVLGAIAVLSWPQRINNP